MKKTLHLLFLIFPIWIFSQNTSDKIIYYDSIGKDVSKENHSSYRIIKDYHTEKDLYQIKDYYKSGVLKMEGNSKTKEGNSREGEFVYYYESGKKKRIENYIKSRLNGNFSEWYENGNPKLKGEYIESERGFNSDLKIHDFWNSNNEQTVKTGNGFYEENGEKFSLRGNVKNGLKDGEWQGYNEITKYRYTDIYNNGNFVSGKSINSDGLERQYNALESRPLPQKGINDFYKFIGSNFVKTKDAVINKVSGKVIVQFVIEKDGKIVEPKILKSLGYGLDEEAIRVITSYENWLPAKQRGIPVRVLYTIPITVSN